MAAFTASQASVTNGSKVVTINSGESIANVRQGDFLFLAGFLVEINRGYLGSASQQYIELVNNWANSNQSNQKAVVIPTTGDFRAAVDAINNANKNVNDNFVAMQNWQTKMGAVTFVNQDGSTTTVKTLKQIEADNATQMDAYHPYPWAMRKVEFEARRAANNEKYAASGFVHKGKQYANTNVEHVNSGLWIYKENSGYERDNFFLGCNSSSGIGESKSATPILNMCGVLFNITLLSENNSILNVRVKLPPPEEGLRTYDTAIGVSVTHASLATAFASETTTNKVVLNRKDAWGFEAFLREITPSDPMVYKRGIIQGLGATINGVTTTIDYTRPLSYYAWYLGDTSTRGRGVDWLTATEQQRKTIASDPENNIFFDDSTGKFYQWCLRGRSFAGAGNGDWQVIDSSSSGGLLAFSVSSPVKRISPQGIQDVGLDFSSAPYFYNNNHPNGDQEYGHFSSKNTDGSTYTSVGVNGQCHILICGTLSRLNRGAYHPSLNPYGADRFVRASSPASGGDLWYVTTQEYNTQYDCFEKEENGGARSNKDFGLKAHGASGRPDARYVDAIYKSGFGGFSRDMRYSAWGLKPDDFGDADLKIKSGQYLGQVESSMSKVGTVTTSGSVYSDNLTKLIISNQRFSSEFADWEGFGLNSPAAEIPLPDCYIIDKNGEAHGIKHVAIRLSSNSSCYVVGNVADKFTNGTYHIVVARTDLLPKVGGEYTHTEVQGPLARIAACEDLKDGWFGSYNPNLPDGVKDSFGLTRPYSGSGADITRTYTVNNGVTWTSSKIAISDVVNNTTTFSNMPVHQVTIYQYKTKAKMTNHGSNSEPLGFTKGLGDVFVSSRCREETARGLGYSLISKVLTSQNSSSTGKDHEILKLKRLQLGDGLKELIGVNAFISEHEQIDIVAPTNNSPALKSLNYNVIENQQGFINYVYTELKHDGTDWGDDGKIHIVDGQSTMLDENGNTVLVGTARCVEPLGWIKNDK
ncbi:hypothetical protein [Pseudoalteromonas porphyrae]|uniref:Uncharacterized protein n=1 Tax=Pseudoalteromonas porphyrae TaxID=187330 RepID=A0A0N0M158_9GAMM|nr:hypothetical protein [Pseudoalteromonas porphyrae]KPH64841.1 hypothetical protein ADS77_03260 [Pseudoalteromonas porphyrae]